MSVVLLVEKIMQLNENLNIDNFIVLSSFLIYAENPLELLFKYL